MGSYNAGKSEIVALVKKIFPKGATCLDVGPSDGKWASLLGDYFVMDAIEIFEPYIEQNHLKEKYRTVICQDIFDAAYEHYDLILFGDVIEHMSVERAQGVLNYAKDRCAEMIIAVPFLYSQGECNGNPWEKHIQDDLTMDIFEKRYPGFHLFYRFGNEYAYYTKGEYDIMDNRRKLDIVITHYDEPWEIVSPCLDILKIQKNVNFRDFRVLLIHDGSPKFEELKGVSFPFELWEIEMPHRGVSAARNKGLELADAEWITFCDCDDCYSDVYSMCYILSALDYDSQFNMLWGKFCITRDNRPSDIPSPTKDIDWTWMANKYFRTNFLKERGIKFNEELEYAEDTAFNNWVRFELKNEECGQILSPIPTYAWCRRGNSVTTSSKNQLRNAQHILKRNLYVTDMYKRYKRGATGLMMARTITDGYSCAMSLVLNNNQEAKKEHLDTLRKFYRENKETIDKVTNSEWDYVLNASIQTRNGELTYIENVVPFDTWFKETIKNE